MNVSRSFTFSFLLFLFIANACMASINFVHVPKCGGTTMHTLLCQNFFEGEIYPYRKVYKGRVMASTWQEVKDTVNEFPSIRHKVVSGHFPMWFFMNKDKSFDQSFFFTILRDPVERVLSQSRDRNRKGLSGNPLEIPANMMCKMFCSDPTLRGEELLKNSMENLEKMDFVIFMDDYDRGVKELFQILGLQVRNIPKRNTTTKSYVDAGTIQKVKAMNELDIRFYQFAKKRFGRS